MKKILCNGLILFVLATSLACLSPRRADAKYYLYSREGSIDLTLGTGLLVRSPVKFDMQLAGEWFMHNNVSFGLSMDFYIRNATAFSFRPFGRYHFDISSLPKLVPYIGAGIGAGIDTNGSGFMDIMVPNFGFKYALTRRIHLGSDFGLHLFTDFDSSRVDFHILFVVLSFRF